MWRQLWTMTVSDLRQRVRDRSVIIFGIAKPSPASQSACARRSRLMPVKSWTSTTAT